MTRFKIGDKVVGIMGINGGYAGVVTRVGVEHGKPVVTYVDKDGKERETYAFNLKHADLKVEADYSATGGLHGLPPYMEIYRPPTQTPPAKFKVGDTVKTRTGVGTVTGLIPPPRTSSFRPRPYHYYVNGSGSPWREDELTTCAAENVAATLVKVLLEEDETRFIVLVPPGHHAARVMVTQTSEFTPPKSAIGWEKVISLTPEEAVQFLGNKSYDVGKIRNVKPQLRSALRRKGYPTRPDYTSSYRPRTWIDSGKEGDFVDQFKASR
jgi:hypothetical protein